MRPKNVGKKKLGYKQYESLLADAHRKLDILAQRVHELQTYFIGYVEYKGDKISFTEFIESKVKKIEKNNETSHKGKNIKSEKSKRYEKIKSS